MAPLLFLGVIQLFNLRDQTSLETAKFLLKRFMFDTNFWVWVALLFSVIAFLYLWWRQILSAKLAVILALLLLFTDTFYFSKDILRFAFMPVYAVKDTTVVFDLAGIADVLNTRLRNKRVMVLDESIAMNKGLYYKSWGIFGYSQFAPADHVAQMLAFGFKKEKSPEFNMCPYYENLIPGLYDFGVYGVLGSFYGTDVQLTGAPPVSNVRYVPLAFYKGLLCSSGLGFVLLILYTSKRVRLFRFIE